MAVVGGGVVCGSTARPPGSARGSALLVVEAEGDLHHEDSLPVPAFRGRR